MATSTLTDGQRVLLAAAAARDDGLVLPVPASMTGNRGTLGVVLNSLLKRELLTERLAKPGEENWRAAEGVGRTTLVISQEGLAAGGIDPSSHPLFSGSGAEDGSSGDKRDDEVSASAPSGSSVRSSSVSPRSGSKLAQLIEALSLPEGATILEIMEVTGWQAHSVRGAISGALKKRLGIGVVSEVREERGRVYSIQSRGARQ